MVPVQIGWLEKLNSFQPYTIRALMHIVPSLAHAQLHTPQKYKDNFRFIEMDIFHHLVFWCFPIAGTHVIIRKLLLVNITYFMNPLN